MAYKVNWSPDAIKDLQSICDYLDSEWSPRVTEKFIGECDYWINLISEFPYLSRATQLDPSIRSVYVSKQNALYFQITEETIYLLRFYDMLQDPSKNPFE